MQTKNIKGAENKSSFPYRIEISTRWSDFDILQHVNNVQFYRYFEFIIIDYMAQVGLNWTIDDVIPYVVESSCHFRKPIPIITKVEAGLCMVKLGNSSVTFEIGLYHPDEEQPSGYGHFVHVYVTREKATTTPIPKHIRAQFKHLMAK